MTVAELIGMLSDYNPGAEVRIATQPSWPLAFTVASVIDTAELQQLDVVAERYAGCKEASEHLDDSEDVVWIATGEHPDYPYAPSQAWSR